MWYALLMQALLLAQPECSGPAPVVLGKQSTVTVSEELLWLPDPGRRFTPDQVARSRSCELLTRYEASDQPLLGAAEPAWYRFRLTTVGNHASDWVLRIPAQGLPDVCVYWPMRSGYERRCAGHGRQNSYGAHYVFDVPAGLNVRQPVLVNVAGGLARPHPITLITRQAHADSERSGQLWTGIFFGLVIAVILLAWVAFFSQRNRAYLYFSGFMLFSALAVAGFLGRGVVFAGLESAWFATAGPPTFSAAALILLVLFCRAYLDLRARPFSVWNGICLSTIVANGVLLFLAFSTPAVAVRLLPVAASVTLGLLLVISAILASRNSQRSRYLLGSLMVFGFGLLMASAGALTQRADLLASSAPFVYCGAILMPVVLVFGVYRHYRSMATERDKARGALVAEQRLALLRSSYCRLTGLPRRGRIAELFARLTHASSPERIRIGVYLLHVDNLSEIRRRHGREMLEQVVNILSGRLRDGLDEDQLLGRLDNWELVVIVPTSTRNDDFRARLFEAAEKIARGIQEPMDVAGQSLEMTVSVGLSIWPLHGYAFDDLLKRCDSALYEAQAAGGNRFKVFTEEAHEARTDLFRRVQDLRTALAENEFELHYQPVHDGITGNLSSLEALLRWRHPRLGLLYPSDFVGLAEESDLIMDLGYWVLSQVMKDLSWLEELGHGELPIALNVSPRQFSHPGFAKHISYYLEKQGVHPSRLHLEITEDSLIDNMEQTREALEQLQEIGVAVYVDDFGVGYSSLNYIRSLPIHGLKIDRTFVQNIGRTLQDEAVIGTIVRLARNLRLEIIAEGVEDEYQRRFLCNLSCHGLQGHLFSKALPRDQLVDYLKDCRIAEAI